MILTVADECMLIIHQYRQTQTLLCSRNLYVTANSFCYSYHQSWYCCLRYHSKSLWLWHNVQNCEDLVLLPVDINEWKMLHEWHCRFVWKFIVVLPSLINSGFRNQKALSMVPSQLVSEEGRLYSTLSRLTILIHIIWSLTSPWSLMTTLKSKFLSLSKKFKGAPWVVLWHSLNFSKPVVAITWY